MNTKKISKIVSVLMIVAMLAMASTVVFAQSTDPRDITPLQGTGTSSVKSLGQQILGIVQLVGSIAAVVVLVVLGIKYMMGSAEEKADYKKSMIPYLVGAVLIFASTAIVGVVYDMAQALNGTATTEK